MQLHAACAALPACCLRLSCFCLSGLKGMGATRVPSRTHGSALQPQQRRRRSASLQKMARARGRAPRAPSKKQKQVAESGAALHEFIYALHHPSLLFSLLCSYPAPPAPSRFPSKRSAALPSLLAPFFESLPLQTNKQQEEFSLYKAPGPFRCIVLIREVESTEIEIA